jgi:hypothetical protein
VAACRRFSGSSVTDWLTALALPSLMAETMAM